jgi:predicted nucleic acid-binding protein
MSLIVDASVAVKWFAAEDGSARAETLFIDEDDLIAPDLIVSEVGNAMWKKFRKGWLSEAQVSAAIDRLPRLFARLISIVELAPRASELTILLDHPIYDCFYFALAERERLAIVTADDRMPALAKRIGGIEVRPL